MTDRRLLFASLLAPLLLMAGAPFGKFFRAQTTPAAPHLAKAERADEVCATQNFAFRHGEELTYKIYYNWNFVWMAAGEVTFRVIDEGDSYHLKVVGETYPSYDWFYKVRDYYDTWVDKETLLPFLSVRDLTEGSYTLYDRTEFDQARRRATSHRGRRKHLIKEHDTFSLSSCMHDMVSSIYYARNQPFEQMRPGTIFPVPVFMDKQEWPLKVAFEGTEEKKIKGLGRFRVYRFSPEVIAGYVFKEDTRLRVWATADDNRLPVLIETPLTVGYIKVVLKDYKNLRHPLKAAME